MITVTMLVSMLLYGPMAFHLNEEPLTLDDSGVEWTVTVLDDVQLAAAPAPVYGCEPTHQWPMPVDGECL